MRQTIHALLFFALLPQTTVLAFRGSYPEAGRQITAAPRNFHQQRDSASQQTCAWANGDYNEPYVCSSGYSCAYESWEGVFGCTNVLQNFAHDACAVTQTPPDANHLACPTACVKYKVSIYTGWSCGTAASTVTAYLTFTNGPNASQTTSNTPVTSSQTTSSTTTASPTPDSSISPSAGTSSTSSLSATPRASISSPNQPSATDPSIGSGSSGIGNGACSEITGNNDNCSVGGSSASRISKAWSIWGLIMSLLLLPLLT